MSSISEGENGVVFQQDVVCPVLKTGLTSHPRFERGPLQIQCVNRASTGETSCSENLSGVNVSGFCPVSSVSNSRDIDTFSKYA